MSEIVGNGGNSTRNNNSTTIFYEPFDEKLADAIVNAIEPPLPKDWRNDPLFHQCISELCSNSLSRLHSEPIYLRDLHSRLIHDNQELAVQNYATFIQTAQCSRELLQEYQLVETKTEELHQISLHSVENACRQFIERGQTILNEQKKIQLTLTKHNQILEMLEIPQLMDTCVRSGYYDEALELVNYIRRLQRRQNSQELTILPRLAMEIHYYTEILLCQLIQQLRTNLQLPACLKVIGYLRRMEAFNEIELRLLFLQCRDSWLRNLLVNLPKDDAGIHATKLLELARVHLFDIVTQYRAVFTEEDSLFSNNSSSGGTTSSTRGHGGGGGLVNQNQIDATFRSGLFHTWLIHRVSGLLNQLADDINLITNKIISSSNDHEASGTISSLLAQAMYFGLSFGRVGCDFRPHVATIFTEAISKQFTIRVRAAVDEFRQALPQQKFPVQNKIEHLHPTVNSSSAGGGIGLGSQEVTPPMDLLHYPVLSFLCNRMLIAMNELRFCLPGNIVSVLVDCLQQSLNEIADILLDFHAATREQMSNRERQGFIQLTEAFLCLLVLHVDVCMSKLLFTSTTDSLTSTTTTTTNTFSLPESLSFQRSTKEKRRTALFLWELDTVQGGCVDWLTIADKLLPIVEDLKIRNLICNATGTSAEIIVVSGATGAEEKEEEEEMDGFDAEESKSVEEEESVEKEADEVKMEKEEENQQNEEVDESLEEKNSL